MAGPKETREIDFSESLRPPLFVTSTVAPVPHSTSAFSALSSLATIPRDKYSLVEGDVIGVSETGFFPADTSAALACPTCGEDDYQTVVASGYGVHASEYVWKGVDDDVAGSSESGLWLLWGVEGEQESGEGLEVVVGGEEAMRDQNGRSGSGRNYFGSPTSSLLQSSRTISRVVACFVMALVLSYVLVTSDNRSWILYAPYSASSSLYRDVERFEERAATTDGDGSFTIVDIINVCCILAFLVLKKRIIYFSAIFYTISLKYLVGRLGCVISCR